LPYQTGAAFSTLQKQLNFVSTFIPSQIPKEDDGMGSLSGQIIRDYELRELAGTGGFGEVYHAYQVSIGREVAIKVILPDYANHPDFVRRFEAEAHRIAQLEHPHIVPLYDYWRESGGAYLVMRWLPGNLRGALKRGSWAMPAVSRLLEQIGGALTAAHRQNIVHRDLKPDNILLDMYANAYLADFGIAKDLGGTNPMVTTQPGVLLGSLAYLSPEQARGAQITPQADIYSLGIVLYELLIGEHPFQGSVAADLIVSQLHDPLPSLRARRPDLPVELDDLIRRATSKTPSERYPDVSSMVEAFRRTLGGYEIPYRTGGIPVALTSSTSIPRAVPAKSADEATLVEAGGSLNQKRRRILIADDHVVFRDGLRVLLDSVADLEVVGEAATGEAVIEAATQSQPDVILMDIKLPGINGIEATRRIIKSSPQIHILIITMFEDDDSVFAALQAGARGYLLKGADRAEILRAIRAIASGEAIFGQEIAQRVIHNLTEPRTAAQPQHMTELTDRERGILNLIVQGYDDAEIAEYLDLSLKTIRKHVSSILSKLQVADRAHAIVRAREGGMREL
jgi:DNA-binding NarL/FixJ family response regulator/serine/threonine protein kinase